MAPISPTAVQNDTRAVAQVRVIVHTLGPAGPTTSDNHWTEHSYGLTHSALQHWDFQVAQGVQVAHVARLIYGKGRDKYHTSGGGSGCRYWVYTIVYDLGASQFIAADASQQLWQPLQFQYHTSGSTKPLNWIQGTFHA
ncbi:hypothetical protein FQN50_008630 [Emmonsiellopsis sp. PD_5]|nr:hypothetical protein FQN50_008630 [Emmonsiellopsis sp. PD_5]